MTLSGKQRRFLRGKGHSLEPVVHVGKEGVSDGLVVALDEALTTHELIKIKLGPGAPDRHATAAAMAEKTTSELVQVLGHTVLLYRRHPDEPKLELP